jgi:DHA2 family multidrug resistance protein-like MFS transporter
VLATVASFAMLGLLFSLPQFFSAVGGHDAFGSGLRLLPVIGGLMVGARIAERLMRRIGVRAVIATGLGLITVASLVGAQTSTGSGYGFVAVWVTITGVGLGLTLPPSMDAAIGALTPERSGVGNGLLQAMRQVGGAIGVAVLGTVLNSGYRSALDGVAVPADAREGVSAGVATASDPGMLHAVQAAFVHGMDVSLVVAGVVALAGTVLAFVLLPARPALPPVSSGAEVLAESAV